MIYNYKLRIQKGINLLGSHQLRYIDMVSSMSHSKFPNNILGL